MPGTRRRPPTPRRAARRASSGHGFRPPQVHTAQPAGTRRPPRNRLRARRASRAEVQNEIPPAASCSWPAASGRATRRYRLPADRPRSFYAARLLRLASWIRPAGGSPAPVSAGAPGSGPRFVIERWRSERGVESLFGPRKRVGWDCSLVRVTIGEPSRSCHGEGDVRQSWLRIGCGGSLRGTETCTRARSDHRTGEARLASLVSKDRSYKPGSTDRAGRRAEIGGGPSVRRVGGARVLRVGVLMLVAAWSGVR